MAATTAAMAQTAAATAAAAATPAPAAPSVAPPALAAGSAVGVPAPPMSASDALGDAVCESGAGVTVALGEGSGRSAYPSTRNGKVGGTPTVPLTPVQALRRAGGRERGCVRAAEQGKGAA